MSRIGEMKNVHNKDVLVLATLSLNGATIPLRGSSCSTQDTLDKLNGLSYMPCTAKLELLDALAEAGANPVKSCLQVQYIAHVPSAAIALADKCLHSLEVQKM